MENQTTPDWLKDGAISQFKKNSNYYSKANNYFLLALIAILFTTIYSSTISYSSKELKSIVFPIEMALSIIVILILYFSIRALIRKKERQASQDAYWQNMYLQSKIDEFESYQTSMNFDIAEIETKALNQIIDIQNNFDEMKKKADQARQLLAS